MFSISFKNAEKLAFLLGLKMVCGYCTYKGSAIITLSIWYSFRIYCLCKLSQQYLWRKNKKLAHSFLTCCIWFQTFQSS